MRQGGRSAIIRAMPSPVSLVVAALLVALPSAAAPRVQAPDAPWRTIRTAHYRIHFPASPEFEPFAAEVSSRIEGIHREVVTWVGSEVTGPTDVVLRDPVAEANGSAIVLLPEPVVELWKTPPESDSPIGHYRTWADLVVVHELVHVHHLGRSQQDPNLLDRVILRPVGPLALKAPRWVAEGYATLIEGKITGSGRPSSPYRAAVIRTWALEGKLPDFGRLSNISGYRAGSMAYLVGSSFLEWLERLDPVRPDVLRTFWRQLASRKRRGFDEAFRKTFGKSPRDLYDRWRAEATYEAVAFERRMREGGLVEGEPWAKFAGDVTDLSVSPEGDRLLARVLVPGEPGLRVWGMRPEAENPPWAIKKRGEQPRPDDPVDVGGEFPKRDPSATLRRIDGSVPGRPEWLDGKRVLFALKQPDAEGVLVWQAFVWTPGGALKRTSTSFPGPRVLREGDRWKAEWAGESVALPFEPVGPVRIDGAGRFLYGATPVGGIWNVVRVALGRSGDRLSAGPPEVLTRTLTAAWNPAPVPDGSALFFTRQGATGMEIRWLDLGRPRARAHPVADAPGALVPETVIPRPDGPGLLPPQGVAPSAHGYSPRDSMRLAARSGFAASPSGGAFQVGAGGVDVLGRFSFHALAAFGDAAGPRGGAVAAAFRGWRWAPHLSLFSSQERPSSQRFVVPQGLDRERIGAAISLDYRVSGMTPVSLVPHAAFEQVENVGGTAGTFGRALAGLSAGAARGFSRGRWGVRGSVEATAQTGRTAGEGWRMARISLATSLQTPGGRATAIGEAGGVGGNPSQWDLFRLGGAGNALVPVSLDASRVTQVALPSFLATGERLLRWRVQLGTGLRAYVEQAAVWSGTRPPFQRIAGLEVSLEEMVPRLSEIPFFGRFSLTAGVHRTLDGEMRGRTVATVVFIPTL